MDDPLTSVDATADAVPLRRRLVRHVPVLGEVVARLDATRRERDRLRTERDQLKHERDHLERQLRASADLASDIESVKIALLKRPSFAGRTETLRRVRDRARERHGHVDPVWEHNGKLAGARLARELGLRAPERLRDPVPLEELQPPRGRRCVVKPTGGASAHGVIPMVAVDQDRWLDLFDLEAGPKRWERILDELRGFVDHGRIEPYFLIEELIEGPSPTALPYDWKLFTVGGQVVASYCRDARNRRAAKHSRYRYWSADWADLGRVHKPERIDPGLPGPHHPTDLVEAAETVARHLAVPFVRVDLFDPPTGVVFSEITPQPGGLLWFGDELDRRFGEVWDRAEADAWAQQRSGGTPR